MSCWEVVNFKAAHRWKSAREKKQHRRGSVRASAHTKSSYLLTKAILCTMWKCVCACLLVCPDQTRCTAKWWCWGWGVNLSSARHIHQGTLSRGLCALTPFLPPFLCPFLPNLGHLVSFCQTHTLVSPSVSLLFTLVNKFRRTLKTVWQIWSQHFLCEML